MKHLFILLIVFFLSCDEGNERKGTTGTFPLSQAEIDYERGYSIIKGCKVISREPHNSIPTFNTDNSPAGKERHLRNLFRRAEKDLIRASALGDIEGVRCLLKTGTESQSDIDLAFLYAVDYDSVKMAKLLSEAGADASQIDPSDVSMFLSAQPKEISDEMKALFKSLNIELKTTDYLKK